MNVFENVRLGITDEDKYSDLDYCREPHRRVHPAGQPAAGHDRQVSRRSSRAGCGSGWGSRGRSRGSPKYLLYDEPTSGLDPVNADIIDGLVQRLDDELGVTSVMVTHDVRGAFRVADRLALLSEGKIVMQGTPQEFLASTNAEGPGVPRARLRQPLLRGLSHHGSALSGK